MPPCICVRDIGHKSYGSSLVIEALLLACCFQGSVFKQLYYESNFGVDWTSWLWELLSCDKCFFNLRSLEPFLQVSSPWITLMYKLLMVCLIGAWSCVNFLLSQTITSFSLSSSFLIILSPAYTCQRVPQVNWWLYFSTPEFVCGSSKIISMLSTWWDVLVFILFMWFFFLP